MASVFGVFGLDDPNMRELIWKKVNEPTDVISDIRTSIIAYMKTDFWEKMSDNARKNNNFENYGSAKNYYFNENGSFSTDDGHLDDELLCLKWVYVREAFNYYAEVDHWDLLKGKAGRVRARVSIEFNSSTNSNIDRTFSSTKRKITDENNDGVINCSINRGQYPIYCEIEYNIDPEAPLIDAEPFYNKPVIGFNTIPWWDDDFLGSWDVLEKYWLQAEYPKCWRHFYRAKSPQPYFLRDSINAFSSDNNLDPHQNQEIVQETLKTLYPVKAFHIRFFKENSDGVYVSDDADNPYIDYFMDENQNGIDAVDITRKIGTDDVTARARFTKEGSYMMIVSVIDKFNKINIFEPEYFIVDKTGPVVTGYTVEEKDYLLSPEDNPVIVTLDASDDGIVHIEDNYTKSFPDLSDYLYVNELDRGVIKVRDSDNIELVNNKIRIKRENVGFTIIDLFFKDNVGNKSNSLLTNKFYMWDRTKPVVQLKPPLTQDTFLTSMKPLSFDIIEATDFSIHNFIYSFHGNTYNGYNINPFTNALTVNYDNYLTGKEGLLDVTVDVVDLAGNHNENIKIGNDHTLSQMIRFNYDDKKPDLIADINGTNLRTNLVLNINESADLNITASDLNFDRIKIVYKTAGFVDFDTTDSNVTYHIQNSSTPVNEVIFSIEAYDLAGNSADKIDNVRIIFSNDNSPPNIAPNQDSENLWRYMINFSDETQIQSIYIKEISPFSNAIESFGEFPPNGTGWDEIVKNVKVFEYDKIVPPNHSICIYAIDIWNNYNWVIVSNEDEDVYIIDDRDKIFTDPENPETGTIDHVKNIIEMSENLIINEGETLYIYTNSPTADGINVTSISISSPENFKIINRGHIVIQNNNNDVFFSGITEGDYKWFGIVNEGSGKISMSYNDYRLYINDAVSGITYKNPAGDILSNEFKNISFTNCKTGIHIVAESANFKVLNMDSIYFYNTIYGVKFDFDAVPITQSMIDDYGSYDSYLSESNTVVRDIKRGEIYCPVEGLKNFTNVNHAPRIEGIVITGEPYCGNTLSLSPDYDYYDDGDPLLEQTLEDTTPTGTRYQWLKANNENGPFTIIPGKTQNYIDIDNSLIKKWVKLRIKPRDLEGAYGEYSYSNSKEIINRAPEARNLKIVDEETSEVAISSTYAYRTVYAKYEFFDIDGDLSSDADYIWKLGTSENGEFTEIIGETSGNLYIGAYCLSNGSYIKFGVKPKDIHNTQPDFYYESDPIPFDLSLRPEIKTATLIGLPEEGQQLNASITYYDHYCELISPKIKWYLSEDEIIGNDNDISYEYENSASFPFNINYAGKYIYFVAKAVDTINAESVEKYSNLLFMNTKPVIDTDYQVYISGTWRLNLMMTANFTYLPHYCSIYLGHSEIRWYASSDNSATTPEDDELLDSLNDWRVIVITEERFVGKYIYFVVRIKDENDTFSDPEISSIVRLTNPRVENVRIELNEDQFGTVHAYYDFANYENPPPPSDTESDRSKTRWYVTLGTDQNGLYIPLSEVFGELSWGFLEKRVSELWGINFFQPYGWLKLEITPNNDEGHSGQTVTVYKKFVNYNNRDYIDNIGANETADTAVEADPSGMLSYNNYFKTTYISGFIYESTDKDFFKFTVLDPDPGELNKPFHIRIKFLQNPQDAYTFKIYEGWRGPAQPIDPDEILEYNSVSEDIDTEYTQYDWGLQYKDTHTGTKYDSTVHFTKTYIIEVCKKSDIIFTGPDIGYTLEVSNGLYPTFEPEP